MYQGQVTREHTSEGAAVGTVGGVIAGVAAGAGSTAASTTVAAATLTGVEAAGYATLVMASGPFAPFIAGGLAVGIVGGVAYGSEVAEVSLLGLTQDTATYDVSIYG